MSFQSIDATSEVDPAPIADAVVAALGPDLVSTAEVEASCVAAIIDKSGDANGVPTVAQNQANLATAAAVADVAADTVAGFEAGVSPMSRIVGSALEALFQATKTDLSGNAPYSGFLTTVTVVGDADGQTAILVPSTGDANLFNDLLGVIITISGAGSVGIGTGFGGPAQVFSHPFVDKATIFVKGDQLVIGGYGPLCRAFSDDITVTSFTNGVTVQATPWVRTNTI